jgi:hypothetical protein
MRIGRSVSSARPAGCRRHAIGPNSAARPAGSLAHLVLLVSLASFGVTGAQEPVTRADSLLAPTEAATLDSLRAKMERSGWGGSFTGYVFRDPTERTELPDGEAEVPETAFLPWQGRPVRHVLVERIDVFTPTRVGTEAPEAGRVSRWGNGFHLDTQEFVIRGFVLQDEGEPLDVQALVDTERLLRGTPYILDATIEIVPVEGTDEVDVVVVTRDKWSIGARAKVSSPSKWGLQLFELNLLGRAIQWNNRFDVNTTRDVGERVDYAGRLTLDNWRGTFMNWDVAYASRRETESTAAGISRTADIPQVRTVGHAIASWTRTREVDPHRLNTEDFWIGRSLYDRDPGDGSSLSRLFLHVRSVRTEFQRRPTVTPDSNRVFHDQVLGLGAVSWSRRAYRKDRLVRGWGRTEDIPVGYRLKLTGGYRWGEFEEQPYAGVELRQAAFHRLGYFIWVAEAGGFLRDGKMEDAAIGGAAGWYGSLRRLAGARLRPILVARWAHVFRPLERTEISIGDSNGFRGLPDTSLPGLTRLTLGTETTAFTRWAPWGFRFAFFGAAAASTVAADPKFLGRNRWYAGIRAGLRIFNEHLVFDALELSVAFYPSTPSGVEGDPYYFGSSEGLTIPGFEIDPPRILSVP